MIFPERFDLKNKIVIVTGGAGLLGSSVSLALAEAGSEVYIAENKQENSVDIIKKIKNRGLVAYFLELDITSEESIKEAVARVIKEKSKIDILVNTAYPRTVDWGTKFEDVTVESLKKNVDIQMNGYVIVCQKVLEIMKKQRSGAVVNFGSTYGVVGPNFSIYEGTEMTMPAAYSAIKGGIINFSRYCATYYGQYNVRVNCICPGGVFDNQNPEFVKRYEKLTPLGRMASPEDIAGPVLFLCSEAASYITGHIMMVDGGWTAW